MRRLLGSVLAAALVLTGLVGLVGIAPAARAASSIVIWSDAAHAPVLQQLLKGGFRGTPVTVVVKDPATVRDELAAATKKTAPDVLWGDLAWTGPLAGAGQIVPVALTPKRAAQFRANVRAGSRVGADAFGVPVQISNLALVTNTKLVPQQPTTFTDLAARALKLVANGKAKVPFALAQGPGANPYTTFALFSGVGGYLFGPAKAGGLDPKDVGLASKALLGNAALINGWNKTGLLDATLTADAARTAFAKGRAPFWLAGPEDLDTLMKLTFVYRIGAVPTIAKGHKAVPLLTIHGFMLTRFAEKHGVAEQADDLVTKFLTRAPVQQALAKASGWYPANIVAAGTTDTGGGRIRAIGNAGVGGVPMPNLAQAGALWEPYGTAWTATTSGPSATKAKKAFTIAQRAAVAAIG